MKLLLPLAESGSAVAQHRIGVMYVLGQGVEKDSAKAVEWYAKAAEQGQAESQHGLGLRLLVGRWRGKRSAKSGGVVWRRRRARAFRFGDLAGAICIFTGNWA